MLADTLIVVVGGCASASTQSAVSIQPNDARCKARVRGSRRSAVVSPLPLSPLPSPLPTTSNNPQHVVVVGPWSARRLDDCRRSDEDRRHDDGHVANTMQRPDRHMRAPVDAIKARVSTSSIDRPLAPPADPRRRPSSKRRRIATTAANHRESRRSPATGRKTLAYGRRRDATSPSRRRRAVKIVEARRSLHLIGRRSFGAAARGRWRRHNWREGWVGGGTTREDNIHDADIDTNRLSSTRLDIMITTARHRCAYRHHSSSRDESGRVLAVAHA